MSFGDRIVSACEKVERKHGTFWALVTFAACIIVPATIVMLIGFLVGEWLTR